MTRTPDQIELAIKRLELMRRDRAATATPAADGSLVPLLTASAEVIAIDAGLDALREQLKAGAH